MEPKVEEYKDSTCVASTGGIMFEEPSQMIDGEQPFIFFFFYCFNLYYRTVHYDI